MFWLKKKYSSPQLFVSIGAGYHQVPLIDEAKKLGYRVVGVDRDTCAAGISRCDIKIQESIDNYGEIYEKLEGLMIYGEIRGVLSKSYGAAVKTASYIAGRFGIPFIPFERMDDFIDKKRMKCVFRKNDIESPPSVIIRSRNDLKKISRLGFPLVIKPATGHAKTDVKLAHNMREVKRYFERPALKKVSHLIEKYILGGEIIAAGIVHGGRYHLIDITDKITTPPPFFVDLMHSSPSRYYHLWERVAEIGQRVASAFAMASSPLVMEILVTREEDLHVIEAVPEFGGEYIPDYLIPARTGYNFIREAVLAVTGGGFHPPSRKSPRGDAVCVKYITGTKGTLSRFSPVPAGARSGILFARMFKGVGAAVKIPSTNHDRLGVVITRGRSMDEAVSRADDAIGRLAIEISAYRKPK